MNVAIKWLKDFVDIDVSPDELARRMTLAGLEAESLTTIGEGWNNVFVGEVVAVVPHPDADRLVLATVEAGEHRLTVVTGAPNIAPGQKVALALAGARLIDAYANEPRLKTLKPGSIRGVRSEGMVCSEKELGLSDEHEGILVLEPDAGPGMPLQEWLGDTVIEFEITPNLVHAFSMIGIAREAGAVLDAAMHQPRLADLSAVPVADNLICVTADDLCPRYMGVVFDGIRIGPSPGWMVQRLVGAGLRSVNNIVDITNYVMLEYGQPTHAFDVDFVTSGRIEVRCSQPGESIETLDHVKRNLPEGTLLITDSGRPIGIAGVMGGANSEVLDTTTSILLEIANFEMVHVRQTARAMKLRTDAVARYERGIDPELVGAASRRAAELILELCPGATIRTLQDVYPHPPAQRSVALELSQLPALLGMDIPVEKSIEVLTRLGFRPSLNEDESVLTSAVPSWRSDIHGSEDIIEEIARIFGYDALPATLPTGGTPSLFRDAEYLFDRALQILMASCGLYETRGYVTHSLQQLDRWGLEGPDGGFAHGLQGVTPVVLRNAIPAGDNRLRLSILPNLVATLIENLKHEDTVRIFEIGRVFMQRQADAVPDEVSTMAIAMAGRRRPVDQYNHGCEAELDFTDVKGVVDLMLARNGCPDATFTPGSHPALHPGRSADIHVGDRRLGIVAELHPTLASAVGCPDHRVAVAELNGEAIRLLATSRPRPEIRSPRFLPVEQDFAVVVGEATPGDEVYRALRRGAGPLATDITLFDVFHGSQVGEGKKSLAYRITFTAPDRALTDNELARVRTKIERTLASQVKGTLRT